MDNVIPFRKKNDANNEPIIASDYFGTERFPLLELLEQIEKNKNKNESST